MSVLYITESQQAMVHLYFAIGGWKYWLQTWCLMRSALHAVLFAYVFSPRASFSRTGKRLHHRSRESRILLDLIKNSIIVIGISAWCQSSWIFQRNGFRRWLWKLQPDWVIENSFLKVSKLFFHIAQRVLPVLFQSCFKKTSIQFKRNNVLRNEDEE